MSNNFFEYLKDLIKLIEAKEDSSRLPKEKVWEVLRARLLDNFQENPFFLQPSALTPSSQSHLPYDVTSADNEGKLYLHLLEPFSLKHPEDLLEQGERRKITLSVRKFFEDLAFQENDNSNEVLDLLIRLIKDGEKNNIDFFIWSILKQPGLPLDTPMKFGNLTVHLRWMSMEEVWSPEMKLPIRHPSSSLDTPSVPAGGNEAGEMPSLLSNPAPKENAEESLKKSIRDKTNLDPSLSPLKCFFDYIKEIFDASEQYDELHEVQVRYTTGERVDAWAEETETQRLQLFYFHVDMDSEPISTEEILNKFVSLVSFFNGARTGGLKKRGLVYQGTAEGELVEKIYRSYVTRGETDPFFKLELILLSTREKPGNLSLGEDELNIAGAEVEIKYLGPTELRDLEQNKDDIVVDFNKKKYGGSPLKILKTLEIEQGYESYVGAIRGTALAEIYGGFGQRVLAGNVRAFLQLTNSVNKGMLSTIRKEPEKFFVYNNGICLIAQEIQTSETQGGLLVEKATNLQIVNGGQTTATLFHAKKDKKLSLSKIWVPVKLSVIKEKDSIKKQKFIQNISQYSNSQSKITNADLGTNTAFQICFSIVGMRETNRIPGSNIDSPLYWYYEKTRGSYKEEAKSARRKTDFTNKYPKHFNKIDLAKWCLSWEGYPDLVSRGAQKCFSYFSKFLCDIEDQYHSMAEEDPWKKIDDEIYQDCIAKGILFISIDKLVQNQSWYKVSRSYKANIITYSISLLAQKIKRQFGEGYSIDFKKIWMNQTLDIELLDLLSSYCYEVHCSLHAPGHSHSDVGEWVKKEECWETIKQLLDGEDVLREVNRELVILEQPSLLGLAKGPVVIRGMKRKKQENS